MLGQAVCLTETDIIHETFRHHHMNGTGVLTCTPLLHEDLQLVHYWRQRLALACHVVHLVNSGDTVPIRCAVSTGTVGHLQRPPMHATPARR
jgi:hypothetical protein